MLNKKLLAATSAVGIEYVGGTSSAITGSASTTTTISLTSLTGGKASAPATGDIVIVYYGTGSVADRAISVTTSGYTQIAKLYANDTIDTNLYVGYKVMGVSADTDVTVSATLNAGDSGAVAIQVWRGVDDVLPLNLASTTATGTNSVLCDPPSITPTVSNAVVISGGAGGHSAGASRTFTSSDLSSFITLGGADNTNDVTVGMGFTRYSGSAVNPAAFTFSTTDSTNYSWAAVSLALRPTRTINIPTFIASATSETADPLVISKPTGTAQNDLMIAIMCAEAGKQTSWSGDTGWTEVADQGIRPSLRIAYKVAGPSEGASYTFTPSAGGLTVSGCILTYRYATYDTIGSVATAADPLVASQITVASDFSVLIAAFARSAASITCTTPTGMTARVTQNNATDPSYLVADERVLAGATGTRSSTVGSTTNVAGVLLSIKPS